MNYNEFNCILFESKLGRNEIKKAANIYWKKNGHQTDSKYDPPDPVRKYASIGDIKKDIKSIIARRRTTAQNIKTYKSDIPELIKRELIYSQISNNSYGTDRNRYRSKLRKIALRRKEEEKLDKYRKLFDL